MNAEYSLSDADFDRIRRLIHARAGISLGGHKREMVYSRIARRLRELKYPSFTDYLNHLEQRGGEKEWEEFINALTTNLTSFFREAHHFPVLAELARRAKGTMTVWCAAASTGEEPYSIAITLAECGWARGSARVIATDIDTKCLREAATAVYREERVAGLSPERLKRFFSRGVASNEGKVRVRPELAAMVEFSRLNLLDNSWPLREPVDAIFCRNVMIYFDKPTQKAILERFAPLLKPGGLLFAGHSENASLVTPLFRSVGQTVYTLASRTGARS